MGFGILQHEFLAFAEDAGNVDISSYAHAVLHPNVTTFTVVEYDKSVIFLKRENGTLTAMKVLLWPSPSKSLRISMAGLYCNAVGFLQYQKFQVYKDTNLMFVLHTFIGGLHLPLYGEVDGVYIYMRCKGTNY